MQLFERRKKKCDFVKMKKREMCLRRITTQQLWLNSKECVEVMAILAHWKWDVQTDEGFQVMRVGISMTSLNLIPGLYGPGGERVMSEISN